MTKIIVCGAAGKMGASIIRVAGEDGRAVLSGALERAGHPSIGSPAAPGIAISADLKGMLPASDVVIDFTSPAATLEHCAIAAAAGKAMVIGTTGITPAQAEHIKGLARGIPVVLAPNMSVGVNVLIGLVQQAASKLAGYDVEIVELHHNQKKDAPSGTALRLAEAAASVLGRDLAKDARYGREGIIGARTARARSASIAVRGGDVVGDHTVIFRRRSASAMELTHQAPMHATRSPAGPSAPRCGSPAAETRPLRHAGRAGTSLAQSVQRIA
jgi:4-hydroxy-tetrahydrodipicolinate reductase